MFFLAHEALSNQGILANGVGIDAESSLTHSLFPKGSILPNPAPTALSLAWA